MTPLITDAEDALSWEQAEHQCWGVGLHVPPDQANTGGECSAFDTTHEEIAQALLPLVQQVLDSYVRRS